ncbi:CNP1-like family protein [Ramlibacter sp.]|uniref:CNP1-like family protein n=1 Tax=Ramlibacter sp. TaxID=1917967 RepID=UPI0018381A13|nr:CNP1-like family protein [Ramlibacter sp.]MBA2675415.1 CNP1-like family protein [Ramlibacter sp.]
MRRELRATAAVLALVAGGTCFAQLLDADVDWKEQEAPPPPALKTQRLIALEMPGSLLNFGVDPDSIAVGNDGVVRYVVVARSSSGAMNVMYEGVRCSTGEWKVYARHNADTGWKQVQDAEWKPMSGNAQARHSLAIARTGACVGRGVNRSASQVARDLRASGDQRLVN